MPRALAALALALLVACAADVTAGVDDDCGELADLDCPTCEGGFALPSCVDGTWQCDSLECGPAGECGAWPEGADCFDECLGAYVQPICVDGIWDCNFEECEPGPCPDPTAPGDVCMGTGWDSRWCEPTEAAIEGCPEVLCTTCNHFERGTFAAAGCSCSCDGERVTCRPE